MGDRLLFAEYPCHGVTVRAPELQDFSILVENLRYEDQREVEAQFDSALEALWESFTQSHRAFVVTKDDTPILIFGVVREEVEGIVKGAVWMVGTPEMKSISRLFARESQLWLDEISIGYDLLWNYVDARNDLHHRWLKWCGFTFLRLVPIGPRRLPFYEFVKITPQ
jgi:hypothetical protein